MLFRLRRVWVIVKHTIDPEGAKVFQRIPDAGEFEHGSIIAVPDYTAANDDLVYLIFICVKMEI